MNERNKHDKVKEKLDSFLFVYSIFKKTVIY